MLLDGKSIQYSVPTLAFYKYWLIDNSSYMIVSVFE